MSTRSSPTLASPPAASTNNNPEMPQVPSTINSPASLRALPIGLSLLSLQVPYIQHSFNNNDGILVASRT